MARRPRDYKAEYARRIERGLARGLSRSQARGHGAERKGAVGASPPLPATGVDAYLGRLKGERRAKVQVTFDDGSVMTLGGKRGGQKAAGLREYIQELIDEYGSLEEAAAAGGYAGRGAVAGFQVVYQ